LITGGAGYIGSHTCVVLLAAGFQVTVVDNLCNSSPEALRRVERICGQAVAFHAVDLRDAQALARVVAQEAPQGVIHFAGLKAVGESVAEPLAYYDNNIGGTINLLNAMDKAGVRQLVFSSSATVYGDPATVPVREDAALSVANPYGRCKLMVEEMLRDLVLADGAWRVAVLRYFNPIGAHPSGLIGDDPRGIPNNLLPYVAQVAVGRRPYLNVFGGDYPTADGTGVRDYIHVMDLAQGHVAALKALAAWGEQQPLTVNLGTGRGYSVLEVVQAFARACGRPVPHRVVARRPGDVPCYYADPSLAHRLLGWTAQFGLERMCEDAWRWQQGNPEGYGEVSGEPRT
jgi:UDP-glucose 4-epimerase